MGKRIPLAVRMKRHIHPDGAGCWIWIGAVDKVSGYGRVQVDGKTAYSHRVMYELLIGPIDADMQLDHLCRVRNCVNPDHLEPVTALVNTHRSPIGNASKSKCPSGHPYAGDNLRYSINKLGERRRICRTCNTERCKAWHAQRASAA